MPAVSWHELRVVLPQLVLTIWGFGVLGLGLAPMLRKYCGLVALGGCGVAAAALWWITQADIPYGAMLGGMVVWDPVTRFFQWLTLLVLALVLLMAHGDRGVQDEERGEYFSLLTLFSVGMMFLASSRHLLLVILSMEFLSLIGYLLVAFLRHDPRASEAALKYFLFGALSSAVLLYGVSLLYAATQTLDLGQLRAALAHGAPAQHALAVLAGILVLVGLGFKISMVPFHLWTPDAYEGAPIPVAALLSVGPKVAGFAILTRLLTAGMGAYTDVWIPVLAGLTVATMTLGNLVALVQTNIKRLLGYSTIAQVGYILIGFVAIGDLPLGPSSVWLYLVAYVLMNCGAFAIVAVITNVTGHETIESYRGLSQRAPGYSFLLALFLLSLAGIPPLAGFVGKFFLFGAAISANVVWLAVAGAINSVIALYYYANIIRCMYLQAPVERTAIASPWSLRTAAGLAAAGTVAIGLMPGPILRAISQSLTLF